MQAAEILLRECLFSGGPREHSNRYSAIPYPHGHCSVKPTGAFRLEHFHDNVYSFALEDRGNEEHL